jgi:hypothetical protein
MSPLSAGKDCRGERQPALVFELWSTQAANPSVFGEKESLAKANFPSRIVFQLPREQAYLATGIEGQQPEKLGGDGDGIAVVNGRTTRTRS